ncbi:MAG: aldo/keto reductase [Gammaproteobacteria bacterium]|nr:aldo/keto reductase [Gammaproteobacteria bacterium]NIR83150.1 aldo/keto reductase [Gammaproteobacteria bacterium]NIR90958.1 aldo/keto reductase [Gammaproteobacteria bacterium]NIU04315.1 aldo/keto reductase [Gammaproteobacteria bacterium]NIV52538.1 aldo/keto reductase [Gammaproteobacteria bacterium]
MRSRPIPSSGEQIPVVGLGSARTFNVDPKDEAALEPLAGVMRNFFDGGGRVVDSSPMYGHSEQVIGTLAARLGITDELFMATKVWTRGEAEGIVQMERSAERMGVARLELIQVHNLVDLRTQLATLKRWREEGRVRYIGVTHSSSWSHDDLTAVVESEPLDFVQLNYNILERNAERRLLPAAGDRGVATLINEPFEKGSLFRRVRGEKPPRWATEFDCRSWAQFFLKFILGHPAVTCAIPATSNPRHAADNVRAGHGALPDAAQRERMAQTLAAF